MRYDKYFALVFCLSAAHLIAPQPSQADVVFRSTSSAVAPGREMEAFINALVQRSAGGASCFYGDAASVEASGNPFEGDEDFFHYFGLPTDRGRAFSCPLDRGYITLSEPEFFAAPHFRTPSQPLKWSPDSHEELEDTGTPQNPENGFNDALRYDGPLYFLSQYQRDFLRNLNSPRAVRVPSLQISTEGAIWTGKCRVQDSPIPQLTSRSSVFEMIGGDMPSFVGTLVTMAVDGSSRSLTSSDFSAIFSGRIYNGRSEARTGLMLWPSGMIGNAAMPYIVADGSDGMRRLQAFLNGEQTIEDSFFSSPEDFSGDTLVFGRINGPYPILNSAFSFYHGPKSELGEVRYRENGAVTYRSRFFPNVDRSSDGYWAVLLPCRSLLDVLELPLVIEMRPPDDYTKNPYYFPIPMAHPDLGIFRDNQDITPSTVHFPSAIFSSLAIDGNVGGGWHKASLEVYLHNRVVPQSNLSQLNDYSPIGSNFDLSSDLDGIEGNISEILEEQIVVEN